MAKYNKVSRFRGPLVALAVLLLVGAIAYGGYRLYQNRHSNSAVGTSSSASTAHGNKPAASSGVRQGGATDKKGGSTPTTESTNSADWTTSTSGVITLQQPIANATIKTGDTLRGTAKIDTVQYRLVDDKVGVIAQGTLDVVGGKFSGILQFRAYAPTGALKVFSIDPQTGAEINHADIKVMFSL